MLTNGALLFVAYFIVNRITNTFPTPVLWNRAITLSLTTFQTSTTCC